VPHSVFTGRPMPGPGEPLFLQKDTDLAVALAMEERDACPACGMPKAWCRDSEKGRARFAVAEDFCWSTYRLAQHQEAVDKKGERPPAMVRAYQYATKFRPGFEPEIDAGLNLEEA